MNGIQEVGGSTPPGSTSLGTREFPQSTLNPRKSGGFSYPVNLPILANSAIFPPHLEEKVVGRIMPKLSAAKAKALTTPGMHGDGEGLYLNVTRSGSRSWVQRISIDGRRREIGLGPLPTVSLARARGLAAANRTAVAEGRDPLAEKLPINASRLFQLFDKPPNIRLSTAASASQAHCSTASPTMSTSWRLTARATGSSRAAPDAEPPQNSRVPPLDPVDPQAPPTRGPTPAARRARRSARGALPWTTGTSYCRSPWYNFAPPRRYIISPPLTGSEGRRRNGQMTSS